MTPDDLVEIEAIKQVKYRYFRFLDLKQWDDIAELFVPEATCAYSAGAYSYEGRDAIVEFFRKAMGRETFLSSLDLTREVLRGLGLSERDVRFAVETFMTTDRKRLYEDYKHYTDLEKLQARARSHTQELEDLFAQDAAEQAKTNAERAAS